MNLGTAYHFDSLVSDTKIFASASLFPSTVTVDSAGIGTTRFILALVPDSADVDPRRWVACAWVGDPLGGEPSMILCEEVSEVRSFSPGRIDLVLVTGSQVSVTPSAGCGCGSRLRSWVPGPVGTKLYGVPRPI